MPSWCASSSAAVAESYGSGDPPGSGFEVRLVSSSIHNKDTFSSVFVSSFAWFPLDADTYSGIESGFRLSDFSLKLESTSLEPFLVSCWLSFAASFSKEGVSDFPSAVLISVTLSLSYLVVTVSVSLLGLESSIFLSARLHACTHFFFETFFGRPLAWRRAWSLRFLCFENCGLEVLFVCKNVFLFDGRMTLSLADPVHATPSFEFHSGLLSLGKGAHVSVPCSSSLWSVAHSLPKTNCTSLLSSSWSAFRLYTP